MENPFQTCAREGSLGPPPASRFIDYPVIGFFNILLKAWSHKDARHLQ
jgi:hypothetical protein